MAQVVKADVPQAVSRQREAEVARQVFRDAVQSYCAQVLFKDMRCLKRV